MASNKEGNNNFLCEKMAQTLFQEIHSKNFLSLSRCVAFWLRKSDLEDRLPLYQKNHWLCGGIQKAFIMITMAEAKLFGNSIVNIFRTMEWADSVHRGVPGRESRTAAIFRWTLESIIVKPQAKGYLSTSAFKKRPKKLTSWQFLVDPPTTFHVTF